MRTNSRLLAALAAAVLAGCVRHSAPIVSTTSLGAYEWPVGLASGTSTATYIFGFGPVGDDSVGMAIARAIGRDGDALINTTVDRRTTYIPAPFLPIVTRVDTRVFGTVVVYVDDDGNEILGPDGGRDAEETSVEAPPAPVRPAPRRVEPVPVRPPNTPFAPVVHQRDGVGTVDFLEFFRGLRRGAAVDVGLAGGKTVSGSFGGIGDDGRTVRLGRGFFGSREVAIDDIKELRSRSIRGESIQWRRTTQ